MKQNSNRTLLNKVPQVPFDWPSAKEPECSSALRVPERPSVFGVPFECPISPLSAIRVKKVWSITRNGLVNSLEFLKTFQNTYSYITLIVFSFLGNKMHNFTTICVRDVIIQGSSKNFSEIFCKVFIKLNMMESGALFLVKL